MINKSLLMMNIEEKKRRRRRGKKTAKIYFDIFFLVEYIVALVCFLDEKNQLSSRNLSLQNQMNRR